MADTPLAPKPWYKSVTLWGVASGLLGVLTTLQDSPGLFTPFVTLGILDPTGVAKIATILTAVGPLLALIGRLRPGGGAPLTLAPPKA